MFNEKFKKYSQEFIRNFLILYPIILVIDGVVVGRNTWFKELCAYFICAVSGFFAGALYEGYFDARRNQKEYPTQKGFIQTAALGAVIAFLALYGFYHAYEGLVLVTYIVSRSLVVFYFILGGFQITEVKRLYSGLIPFVLSFLFLYIVFPETNKAYGNLSAAALLLYIAHILFSLPKFVNRLKNIMKNLQNHKLGKGLRYILGRLKNIRHALKDRWETFRDGYRRMALRRWLKGVKKAFYRFARLFYRDRETLIKKGSDYTDEISTLFSFRDTEEERVFTVRGLRKITDPLKKVRYAFGLIMTDLVEKKVGIKFFDTVEVMREKSEVIDGLDLYMDRLSDIYQVSRYGPEPPGEGVALEAESLALSANDVIEESYWQPKIYANTDLEFKGEV